MTEYEERIMDMIREAVILCHALRGMIESLEARKEKDSDMLLQITIDYTKSILRKYEKIASSPVKTRSDGRIVPILNKN